MVKKITKPIYYGWAIVAIGMTILTLVIGTVIQAYGLFVIPVSATYRLSRAEMNSGLILLNFGMAASGPIIGRILDQYSARNVTMMCAGLAGCSLVTLGFSSNLWLNAAVLAGPLAFAVVGCGTLTSTALVARWFTLQRGRAMALVAIGFSLGPVLMVPLIGMLLSALGWRQSLAVLGIVIGTVVLLLAWLIRERPGSGMAEPSAMNSAFEGTGKTDAASKALTLGQVLRKPLFWMIVLSSGSVLGIQQATIVSMIPFAQGEGYTVAQAATVLSTMGAMSISGKLMLAWLGDRVARTTILSVLFALLALASGGLSQAHTYATLLAYSAMFGLAMGASTPAYLTLLADRFGAASFGTVSGSGSFISTLIGAGLLRYGGEVYDRTGGYRIMFLSFLVLAGTATALIAMSYIVGSETGKRSQRTKS